MSGIIFNYYTQALRQQVKAPVIVTPPAPGRVQDDKTNTLLFLHDLGNSEIEVSINGAAFGPQPADGYKVGDVDLPAGYYQARTRPAYNRNVSPITASLAFGKDVVAPVTKVPKWLSGLRFFGDSNTAGAGMQKPWSVRCAEALTVSYTNFAINGYTANQQASIAMSNMPMVAEAQTAVMLGTNNFKLSTDLARTKIDIMASHRTIAAAQFAKETIFPSAMIKSNAGAAIIDGTPYYASFGSRVLKARAGANPNLPMPDWYYVANGNEGDSLTFNFIGTGFAVRSFLGANPGDEPVPVKIEVDGQDKGTWVIPYGMDKGGADVYPVTGLSNVMHTGKITFTKAGKHAIDSVDILKSPADTQINYLQVNNLPHFAPQGLVGNEFATNSFELTNDVFDEASNAVEADLKAKYPGFGFYFVHINDSDGYQAQDPTKIQADGIHSTDDGAQQIANKVISGMAA